MKLRKTKMILLLGLFLFIIDRLLKYQALHSWSSSKLLGRWFGWQPFLNPGVAFGLPVPQVLVVLFSVVIILFVGYYLFRILNNESGIMNNGQPGKFYSHSILQSFSLSLIFVGATSNLIDRIIYHNTVDYLLIFTGVFNLADGLIIAGFVVYLLLKSDKTKKLESKKTTERPWSC